MNDVSNGVGIFEWYATIGLTTDVSSVSEHDGATTVTVTAHIHPTVYGNVYVTVSVGGGTATSGTDYAAVSNFTITIPNKASSATGTFTLTPTQDALLESDETININGSGSHFNFYAGQGTSVTLTDAQPISLSAIPSSISEGAPGTQVAVSATATGTLPTPRTVTVSVGDTGTATSGTDYAAVSDFDIVIPANKTGATNTFTLTPTKDSASEGDETIGVSGSSTAAYVYPTTLTLADTNPAVTLTAAPSSIAEGASATSVTVTATAASAIATARTVTVAVGDTGTATSGTDYAAVSDFTITIAANKTSGTGTFTLTPTDDTTLEGDETIGVAGTSSEAATISGTSLTLTDDDLPTITLATVPADVKIAEGAGLTSVTVRATAAAAMKAKTTVTLTVGAGGDSATTTTDYTTSNVQTITIPQGQSTAEASFELTPKQDTSVEGDETVSISGSSSGGHTVTGTSLKLTDDDKHVIALSASPSSVGEGASATSVTVTATAKAATSSARTVRVQVGDSGTATSGTDYAAVSDFTITIAANAKTGTGTFTLTPTQDTSVEGNETIGVEGASPNSTVTGTTMTLTDDDSYPAITLSANPSSVAESASGTTVTVTATAASAIASARTVTVSVGDSGTASRGTDYATVADFTITIAANATSGTGTFTLTPSQDTVVEGSETIGVAGASPSSTVTGTTVTLTDDDTHAITLSASPSSVSESKASETVTVTATLNAARSSATAVTVSVGESTDAATSGTDYEAVSDFTVTIAANATSGTGTFTFKPKTDTAYEGFENVTISGTTASGGGANAQNANASIPVADTSLSIHDASNYPAVTLTAAPSSVGEGAGATSVTVTATAASAIGSSREVTVSVGGSGTATSGTDYTAVSDFIIKIAANATSGTGTFTLTPTDDSVVEASETIGVAGTSLSTTVTGTTVTLTDNDSAEVTINDASAAEGSSMTFTVTLDTAVDGGLTVTPGYTNVTASSSDYTANTTGLSFTGTAGETQTFTVPTTQDDVVEGNETFTVGLTVSGTTLTGSITSTDTGTGTINSATETNVDTATLTINDASAAEGDGITFTVTLSEAVQGGLTVTPSFTDVTAVEGTDYDENTTGLSFTGTKGETKTFTVSTDEDAVLEANETFTVSLTVSGTTLGSNITSTDTGTGTINNDDSTTVTVNDASASEGNDMTFTVTLSEAVQGGLTVTPDFTDVTATEGTDYDENTTALSFTGTKGETKTFTVSTDEDAVLEANETFTVGLSVSGAPTGVTVSDTGTGTINDDDSAAVTVDDASADEGESMTFTVTLSEAVQGGLKVTPSYTNGTAASGDYTANTTALTFTGTKGETKTFTVSTTEDAVLEADETFTVGLTVSNAPTGTTVTATDTGTGTINNDDSAAVTVENTNADEGNSMTFTVTLDKAVQGGLKVTPGYTNDTAASGDYTANTTALTFTGTANETKTFTVSTTEDAVLEANETFTVDLTVSGTSLSITATDTGTGTINNDDSAAVTIADAKNDEGDSITFTVTLDKAVQGGLTVTPGFTDGTAVKGTDYDENTAALTFSGTANETKTFTVQTTEDAVLESDETFTVGLTVSGTSLDVTDDDTATGTITDDDGAKVTIADANADEGDSMTFTVTLGAAVQGGLTVTPDFTDVTATEGTDYDENTTALTFTGTANETKTFTVSTTEDAVLEADETFTVGLTVSGTTLDVTDDDTGTGTINNDDSATVKVNDASASEGSSMTFTVTLDKAVQGGLTVTPGFTDGTAVEGTDYTENTTALSFTGTANETKTFTVSTTDDEVLEADETFTVGLSVSNAPSGMTSTDTGTGTIDNDDGAGVIINDAKADEGQSMTFTVTLTEAVQGGLTVTPGFTNGTDASTDYTENTTPLNFSGTANETRTFTVQTTEDTVVERNETFTVGLSVSGTSLDVTDTDTGTGTINDDDDAPSVNLSVTPARVAENDGATLVKVTATFSNSSTYEAATTVTVSVGDGTDSAASGTDYEDVAAFTITIAAGASSGNATFTLTPTNDTLVEGDEAITVSGTNTTLTVNGTQLILTDNDDPPAIDLLLTDASVPENAGPTQTTLTARFSNASTYATDTTVTVTVGNGQDSATSGTDYTPVTSFTVVIAAGASSGIIPFTLTPIDDTLIEGDEDLTVDGTADNDLAVNDTDVKLIDDDGGLAVDLSVNPARASENDGATPMTVTATFSNSSTYDTDTTVTVSVGDGSDSATEGVDYQTVANFTVTIAAGASSGSAPFTLTPIDDTLAEGDERISVDGTATGLTVNGAHVTLVDDDVVIDLSVRPARVAEDAGATPVTLTAAFSNAVTYDTDTVVTVTVGTAGDSATEGTDYQTVASFTVTIKAGASSGSAPFTLTPIDDTLAEGDERISVNGTADSGLTVNGTHLTLVDDDVVIDLSVNPASVAEDAGATPVTLTAAFSPITTYDTDTTVTVTVGAAGDSATEGVDYQAVASFAVTIAAGASSGSTPFTLTPIDDTLVEDDETISVNGAADRDLTVNGTHLTLTDAAGATAEAVSDDVSDDASDDFATVTVSNARAVEGDAMTFTLTLDKTAPGSFTVTPVYSDGTATADVDYTPNTSSVAFAGQAGEQHTFTVATLADDLVEPAETFGVSLAIAGPSGIRGRSGSGTIDTNDVVTVVAVVSQDNDPDLPTTLHEAGGPRVMRARVWANGLTFSTDMAFTVKVGNGNGTAQEGVDYETVPDFDIIIPAGATSAAQDFTVTPIDDRIVEGDETIGLDGTLPGYEVAPSTVTILDDDAPAFSLAVAPARVRESAGPTPVTVTVETGGVTFPADLSVAVTVSDGTAIAGDDYDRVAAFDLRIAAGETSGAGTFTLVPTADGVKEDDEDIRVAGLVGGYDLAPASVVLADDTVLPNHLDAVNRALLPHVARALLASNIAALAECGVSGAAPGSSLVSLLGTHGEAFANGETNLEQVLGGADFQVPLRASQEETSRRFKLNTLWGCGDYRALSDRSDDALDWEGNLFSLHLGVDAQVLPNLVTGLALSRSQARFDYQDHSAALSVAGQHRTDMTSLSPYARWTLSQGMSLWAMAGLGWGSVEIDDALATGSSDAGLTLAALGLDNALLTRLHGRGETSLRLKAEGSLGRLSVDGSETLGALAVEVQRLRLALEGSRTWNLSSGRAWTTALEVGLRHDGGDGATGSGVEVGGGVNYHDARLGLTLALSGRTLVAHGADYDEWGVGGVIRYDPGTQGVGLSASLQPVLGQAQSGVAQLWEQTLADPSSALASDAARVEAELGYGLAALGGRGLVRPYTQVSMAGEGSRHYRMGSRLELGDTLRVGVEVGRREASGSETDHGVMLRLELGSAGGGVAVGSGVHGGGVHNAGPVDGRLGRFSSRAWDAGRE